MGNAPFRIDHISPEQAALKLRIYEFWMNERWSAGQISAAIGLSRSAVIGHIHRMNLPPRDGVTQRTPRSSSTVGALQVRSKPVPLPTLTEAEIAPLHVELEFLGAKACRWPYGSGAPFTFCGHPVHARGNLCAGHAAIAFVKSHAPKPRQGHRDQMRSDRQFGF